MKSKTMRVPFSWHVTRRFSVEKDWLKKRGGGGGINRSWFNWEGKHYKTGRIAGYTHHQPMCHSETVPRNWKHIVTSHLTNRRPHIKTSYLNMCYELLKSYRHLFSSLFSFFFFLFSFFLSFFSFLFSLLSFFLLLPTHGHTASGN